MPAFLRRLFPLILLAGLGEAPAEDRPVFAPLARITAPEIPESSGIVASRKYPGIFWTHNDSGDEARFFAIRADGSLVATFRLAGVTAVDWEDIALDDKGFLYLADVGDNRRKRDDQVLYKVAEPDPSTTGEHILPVVETIPVSFPEGHANCEALCFDPRDGLLLITKDPQPAGIYHRVGKGWERIQTLDLPDVVTGADLDAEGHLALTTYMGFYLLERSSKGLWQITQHIVSQMRQSEAVCWDGRVLMFTNEQREIYRLDPHRFGREDVYLPNLVSWSPSRDLELTPVEDAEDRPSRLTLSFRVLPEETLLSAKLPADVPKGRILLLFSTKDPGLRLSLAPEDSVLLIEQAGDKVGARIVEAATGKPLPQDPGISATLREGILNVRMPAVFYGAQRAMAVLVVGYDKEPCGWPFAHWRVCDKPYMWARQGKP